jgi:hypothetical protein
MAGDIVPGKIEDRRNKMPKAGDLKKGNVVEINNEAYMVKHIDVRSPSARGAVTLSNGVEIQIPEYLEAGEMIKVNTETKKFMSKA